MKNEGFCDHLFIRMYAYTSRINKYSHDDVYSFVVICMYVGRLKEFVIIYLYVCMHM